MRLIISLFIFSATILLAPFYSYAQFSSDTLRLELSPTIPEANAPFSVKLTGNNESRASTQWFINGTENTTFKNQNSITLQSGGIGSTMSIYAKVTLANGKILEAKNTITPNRVDIIIEANTAVPPFYKGKKLPSSGTLITAAALVFTKEKGLPSEYSYLWKLDGKTQGGSALKGQDSFTFTPGFGDENILSVDIFDRTGKHIASKSQIIPILKPELYFYEKNPLRGLSFVALSDPYIFIGDETTIKAEGYFMDYEDSDTKLLHEWKIDGIKQLIYKTEQTEITLSKEGRTGSVMLSFHIRNLNQLLQGAKKSLSIQF